MKALSLALTAALLGATLAPSAAWAYPRDNAAVVEVDILSRADIHRLNELGMDIMNVKDAVAEIAAVPEEIDLLWANGYRPRIVVPNMRDAALAARDRGEYHDYGEITADLAAWHAAYPAITELVSIGQSVQNRQIWGLKITDNPSVEEAEAEVVWVGGHHGDETIGVEVCYYMAKHLLENYGTDAQVTWLVNNREFWVIPMLNPDGHTNGSRYNAQGTDLNRNYTCPCGCNAGTAFSAPETRALRDLCLDMNPATSLQFHAGAVYVNYLWDYTYSPTPDEPLIITLSNGYGARSGYPVTNGADWYIAHGTCQDWCYNTRGEIGTTIEVSTSKNPPASSIDGIVNLNRAAMLYQARKSGKGITGVVTNAGTAQPLSATISIPQIGKDVYTDPDAGDYHRLVQSGTYTVTASAPGYQTQTVTNVSASLDTFVVVNFALEPPSHGTIAGHVYDENGGPLGAEVTLMDLPGFVAASDPATGHYELPYVPVGTHHVRARKAGYFTDERLDVVVEANVTTAEDFVLVDPVFGDDLGGLSQWTGSWGLTTSQSHSAPSCMTDSPSGNYPNNALTTVTLASPIDLSGATTGAISFWHRYDTEAGYDFCYVYVSANNGSSWTLVGTYSGYLGTWSEVLIDVSPYVGTSGFKVRFVLDSDGYVTRDGWYVDDVQVTANLPGSGVQEPGEGAVARLAMSNHPNPFTVETALAYELPAAGSVCLRLFDAGGRLVRTLEDGDAKPAGRHRAVWDGLDDQGSPVSAGVYFALVESSGERASRKLVLLR